MKIEIIVKIDGFPLAIAEATPHSIRPVFEYNSVERNPDRSLKNTATGVVSFRNKETIWNFVATLAADAENHGVKYGEIPNEDS